MGLAGVPVPSATAEMDGAAWATICSAAGGFWLASFACRSGRVCGFGFEGGELLSSLFFGELAAATDGASIAVLFASRCTPTTYSLPSPRQYLVVPENCSKRHRILSLEPTAMGICTRMQAPPADLSSIRAATVCTVPPGSSHEASTSVITGIRRSGITALMPDLSARN